MPRKNEVTSAGAAVPADLAHARVSDTIFAAQTLSDGNAREAGTLEWPRRPAPSRQAGPKGVIAGAFCRRMVHETGKGAPQVLAA